MKTFILLGALVCLSQLPMPAQDVISTSNLSMEGTWITQLTDANGNVSLFEVGTYSPDGSYTGANVNPSHTAHKGVWVRIGDRKFAQTILFFSSQSRSNPGGHSRFR